MNLTYPISLGVHSQTDIADAVNDLHARLAAIEAQPGTPALEARIERLEGQTGFCLSALANDVVDLQRLTAAPVSAPTTCVWGNKPGFVDHPKGCACGLCEQVDGEQPAAPGDDAAVIAARILRGGPGPKGPVIQRYHDRGPEQIAEPGNDAAVDALRRIQLPSRADGFRTVLCLTEARAILAAIRAGQVPGCYHVDTMRGTLVKDMKAEIAALQARVAELERQIVGEMGGADTMRKHRDQARADLAALLHDTANALGCDVDNESVLHKAHDLRADLARAVESERRFRAEVKAGFRKHNLAVGPEAIDGLVRDLNRVTAERDAVIAVSYRPMVESLTAELAEAKALRHEAVEIAKGIRGCAERGAPNITWQDWWVRLQKVEAIIAADGGAS